MTKKFWNDWQKRVDETKNIHLFYSPCGKGKRMDNGIIHISSGDRFKSAEFHGDTVFVTIVRRKTEIRERKLREYTELEYMELNRDDIGRVSFYDFPKSDAEAYAMLHEQNLFGDWDGRMVRFKFIDETITDAKGRKCIKIVVCPKSNVPSMIEHYPVKTVCGMIITGEVKRLNN